MRPGPRARTAQSCTPRRGRGRSCCATSAGGTGPSPPSPLRTSTRGSARGSSEPETPIARGTVCGAGVRPSCGIADFRSRPSCGRVAGTMR
eukprot:gene21584-biopygen7138